MTNRERAIAAALNNGNYTNLLLAIEHALDAAVFAEREACAAIAEDRKVKFADVPACIRARQGVA